MAVALRRSTDRKTDRASSAVQARESRPTETETADIESKKTGEFQPVPRMATPTTADESNLPLPGRAVVTIVDASKRRNHFFGIVGSRWAWTGFQSGFVAVPKTGPECPGANSCEAGYNNRRRNRRPAAPAKPNSSKSIADGSGTAGPEPVEGACELPVGDARPSDMPAGSGSPLKPTPLGGSEPAESSALPRSAAIDSPPPLTPDPGTASWPSGLPVASLAAIVTRP
jgi:hypothetical protein